jgi:hypothetical protein
MIAEVMGIVEKGALKLDQVLPYADHTRVRLTVQPVCDPTEARMAWQKLLALMDEKPLVGLAGKFSREELYERD